MFKLAESALTLNKDELKKAFAQSLTYSNNIKLSSGGTSNVFLDCTKVISNSKYLNYVIDILFWKFDGRASLIGGPATGSIPISTAFTFLGNSAFYGDPNALKHYPKSFFYSKNKNDRTVLEGTLNGNKAFIVEDVITTGNSVQNCITACKKIGIDVTQVIVLVDREAGGLEAIKETNPSAKVCAVFTLSELEKTRHALKNNSFSLETEFKLAKEL